MSVRLFVLGVLCSKSSYGYEIKETALLWGLPRWADIQEGSIYHALGKLTKEKLIAQTSVENSENNRPRYIYNICPEGRTEFLRLLRDTCRAAAVEKRDIDIALSFIDFLPPGERLQLLQERHDCLVRARAELDLRQKETDSMFPHLHPWVAAGMRHSRGRLEFEIEWNAELLKSTVNWPTKEILNSAD